MIDSFADQDTADLFEGKRVRRFTNILVVAERMQQQLDTAGHPMASMTSKLLITTEIRSSR